MSNNLDFLIEIGTEELPPKALKSLSDAFSNGILEGLLEAKLIEPEQKASAQSFASPRRLALLVPNTSAAQANQIVERKGPSVAAAFDADGNPTPAALGFAKSCGVEIEQLQRQKTDKGEWLSYNLEQQGQSIDELLPAIAEQSIKRLPIPKRMRWGDSNAEFVRPVHWLVVMHGERVIDINLLDTQSSNFTQGHRFLGEQKIEIDTAANYAPLLEEHGKVLASFENRRDLIEQQIQQLASDNNCHLDNDPALLDEVTGLVEMPFALLGNFDEAFLSVPDECLISSMRDHQKYFHLRDDKGQLQAKFITVSNIPSSDPQRVIAGNERVLLARLSDAQFFWETDQKQALESRLPQLDAVLFHAKLGNLGDKTKRLQALSQQIAELIDCDTTIVQRSAELCKADLVTLMVGEFDSLQGIMGHYYADLQGENSQVSDSIEQHYWPKFAGDELPQTAEAQALALADKLDSLVGIYNAGEVPTGDKDPHGLRRAALGILRILIEQQLTVDLPTLVEKTAQVYQQQQNIEVDQTTQESIVDYILSRLKPYYQSLGVATQAINAVAACRPTSPLDFAQRLEAVKHFDSLDEATDLSAANKRISNILKKEDTLDSTEIDESLLQESAEKTLFEAILNSEQQCLSLFESGDYQNGLTKLATLRTPVDDFFEHVMVMSEDQALRQNRLKLLQRLRNLFTHVADISQLQN